jgi:hypothetical protein
MTVAQDIGLPNQLNAIALDGTNLLDNLRATVIHQFAKNQKVSPEVRMKARANEIDAAIVSFHLQDIRHQPNRPKSSSPQCLVCAMPIRRRRVPTSEPVLTNLGSKCPPTARRVLANIRCEANRDAVLFIVAANVNIGL